MASPRIHNSTPETGRRNRERALMGEEMESKASRRQELLIVKSPQWLAVFFAIAIPTSIVPFLIGFLLGFSVKHDLIFGLYAFLSGAFADLIIRRTFGKVLLVFTKPKIPFIILWFLICLYVMARTPFEKSAFRPPRSGNQVCLAGCLKRVSGAGRGRIEEREREVNAREEKRGLPPHGLRRRQGQGTQTPRRSIRDSLSREVQRMWETIVSSCDNQELAGIPTDLGM